MSEKQGNNLETPENKLFSSRDDFFHWLSKTNWETLEENGWIEESRFIQPKIQGNTVKFEIFHDIASYNKIERRISENVIFYKTNINNDNLRLYSFYENYIFINCTFNGANFEGATFRGEVNFINNNYKGQTKFSSCDFSDNVTIVNENFDDGSTLIFEKCKFKKRVECNGSTFGTLKFDGCTFDKYLDFINNNYKGQTKFSGCEFSDKVTIVDEKFDSGSELVFHRCNFTKRVKCNDLTFDTLVFDGCTFDDYLDLSRMRFMEKFALEFSQVKNLFFNFIDKDKDKDKRSKFENFSLKGIAVEKYIFYEETEVTDAANHQTFTILKHNAIKSNDSIRAIEFHRQEMDKYLSELKEEKGKKGDQNEELKEEKGKKGDRIILCFEKWVSNYGTSFAKVLIAILVSNLPFYFIEEYRRVFTCFESVSLLKCCVFDYLEFLANSLNPFGQKGNVGVLGFIQIIVNIYLIYELQKSLRKFSRKF